VDESFVLFRRDALPICYSPFTFTGCPITLHAALHLCLTLINDVAPKRVLAIEESRVAVYLCLVATDRRSGLHFSIYSDTGVLLDTTISNQDSFPFPRPAVRDDFALEQATIPLETGTKLADLRLCKSLRQDRAEQVYTSFPRCVQPNSSWAGLRKDQCTQSHSMDNLYQELHIFSSVTRLVHYSTNSWGKI
jgi:hypothetical protein